MNINTCYPNNRPLYHSLFDDLWSAGEPSAEEVLSPKAKVTDRQNSIGVELELPGIKKEDIKVEIKKGVLSVSAEKKVSLENEKDRVTFSEISHGKYNRSFRLTDDIETEKVEARYENGVLFLELRKKEELKPKQIEIK